MTTKSVFKGTKPERRLDAVVAATTGLTRSQARGLILAGKVRVDDVPSTKPGANVREGAAIVVDEQPRYVSRGGEKLEGALRAFGLDVSGLDVLDVGASTGGFTDALLQHGARHVTALDVGYGQLAWKLRSDPRVTVDRAHELPHAARRCVSGAASTLIVDRRVVHLAAHDRRARGRVSARGRRDRRAGEAAVRSGPRANRRRRRRARSGDPRSDPARGAGCGARSGVRVVRAAVLAAARTGRQRGVLLRAAPRRHRSRRRRAGRARHGGARAVNAIALVRQHRTAAGGGGGAARLRPRQAARRACRNVRRRRRGARLSERVQPRRSGAARHGRRRRHAAARRAPRAPARDSDPRRQHRTARLPHRGRSERRRFRGARARVRR